VGQAIGPLGPRRERVDPDANAAVNDGRIPLRMGMIGEQATFVEA